MTFADSAKYSMIEYHGIYPTLGQFMDHMFMSIGSGMEWVKGELVGSDERAAAAMLPALERLAANPGSIKTPRNIPWWLKHRLGIYEFADDIAKRLADPDVVSCYGLYDECSRVARIPDDVKPDWLNAAILHLNTVVGLPVERFVRYRMAQQERNEERLSVAFREVKAAKDRCGQVLDSIQRRFPDHEYVSPVGTIALDPNRPDVDGGKYWPPDGSAVGLADLVAPFKRALEFAYTLTPKGGTAEGEIDEILGDLADEAVKHGQRCVNDDVIRSLESRQESAGLEPLRAVAAQFPRSGRDRWGYADAALKAAMKRVQKNFRLRRRNNGKDIPYDGYPNGRTARVGGLEPSERMSVEWMGYESNNQGRNALEVILGCLITVVSEQGARIAKQAFVEACALIPPEPEPFFAAGIDLPKS